MYFAEFYQAPVGNKNPTLSELIPGCGDRSVLILDGRNHSVTHHDNARQWAKKHGWLAYRLCKGESFTRRSETTSIRWAI